MLSVRLFGSGDLRIQEEPVPAPKQGEKLVRVKAVGVCGSDLHWFEDGGIGDAQLKRPLVLGHEFAGITEDGGRMAVDPALPCGECEFCQQGNPNLCPAVIFAGHGEQDGGLREYIAWDSRRLYPIPDTLSESDGAMLEPLGVALHALDLGKLRAGMTIGVFGCGPIGLLVVQLARRMGAARIIATDVLPHRVEAAITYGSDEAYLANRREEIHPILEATQGRGVDVAFECAGEQAAVDTSFAAAVPGGKVILVGIPANDQTSFSASTARRKGLTIKLVRRMKHTYPRAIEMVTRGLVDVSSLVTHTFPLAQAMDAFQLAVRREGLKVMITL
ncbi:MAG: zinc-binding dehydrogenase [Anaerolineales bacterium]|nr:zinc-binding dehydrogenase [Anaerolineales bacterium]